MAEYQRTAGKPVTFSATTNGTRFEWKIDGALESTQLSFTKIFNTIGYYTVEFTAYNECNDKCIQTIRLSIVQEQVLTEKVTIGDYKMAELTKITETPIASRRRVSVIEKIPEETNVILRRIEILQETLNQLIKSKVNYNTHYFVDTSDSSRRKFDIRQALGVPAAELYVISEGGGFTLELNDEGYAMTARTGFKVSDEKIERIWVTGSGSTGTGRIRIGAWR